MKKVNLTAFVIFTIILTLALKSYSQILTPITDSIEMRDGKKLAADIYLPDTGKAYPVILIQTPYNRLFYRLGLPLKIGKDIQSSPYAFVIVDWRCFYGSAAACKALPERGKDGYDVIDWISKQSWSDGKIGTWGPSALGKIQYLTAKEQHPNHTCAVPLVAGSQTNYQEYFPNGVFRTEYVDQLDALGYNMKNTLLQHPYYDFYWQYAENASMYPQDINIPMLLIGGWFDHNIDLMFDLFDTLTKASDPSVRDLHKFLVGPWAHNSVGKKEVGELEFPHAEGASDSFALLFFDYWLRGAKNGWPLNKKYTLHDIYSQGEFECFNDIGEYKDNFKFKEVSLYLWHNRMIGIDPPVSTDSVQIMYDPRNPSPTVGGATLRTDLKQGPWNIKDKVIRKQDNVLFYDHAGMPKIVHMLGKPKVDLFVSSNRFDTDFSVRLCLSNSPFDSSNYIISDAVYRMRFRNGFTPSDTQSIEPGKIYKITLELPQLFVNHVYFDSFQYLSLVISSSNYPRFDRNLNNGKDLYTAGDTMVAENYIYFGKNYPSRLYFDGFYEIYGGLPEEKNAIQLFPNPVQNTLYIDPQKIQTPISYSILDMQGKEIMKGMIKSDDVFSLDVSGLKPQIYLVKIWNEKETVVMKCIKTN
jgi:predicted acyl esterase